MISSIMRFVLSISVGQVVGNVLKSFIPKTGGALVRYTYSVGVVLMTFAATVIVENAIVKEFRKVVRSTKKEMKKVKEGE